MTAVSHKFVSAKSDGGDATLVRPSNWNATHSGNSLFSLLVAANDSTADDKDKADYLCDGTADDVQIQAAWDALPSLGGEIILAPGTYAIATTPLLDDNKRVHVVGYGAKLNLAASTTGLKIAQGISNSRGVTVEGFRIDGQSNASTVGVELEDTNNSALVNVEIENCATGILLDSQAASNYVEGTLIDFCTLRANTNGVVFSITSGTGSFMQTVIRGLKCVVGASGTGMVIPQNALMLRATIEASFWIGTDETGISIDGNMEDSRLRIGVEGEGGATGNTAMTVGANATNMDQMWLDLMLTGTIATQISNTSSKVFRYWSGGSQNVSTSGTSILGFRRHGDSANKLQFEELTAGGRISAGSGSSAVDVNLYRSAANVWTSDDKIDAASVNLQTKAGAIADGDVTGGAADGDIGVNTTDHSLEYRSGGSWRRLMLPLPSRGGTVLTPSGAINVIVWRAPYACTVTNVRGYRVGGTGATINARRNGSSDHLSSALSLSSADTWMDGGSVQNTAYAAGDKLEIMVVSVTGSPTQIAVQIDFTRP